MLDHRLRRRSYTKSTLDQRDCCCSFGNIITSIFPAKSADEALPGDDT